MRRPIALLLVSLVALTGAAAPSSAFASADDEPLSGRPAAAGLDADEVPQDDLESPTPTPTVTPSETPEPEDPVRTAEYWLDEYGVTDAWETTRGAGTTIAVIDTGIVKGPEEFEGAVAGGTDVSGVGGEDGRTPVGVQDQNHGSYVASLAAARGTGEDTGMIGVAPEAQLLSISIGFGSSAAVPFDEQVADAMVWAVDNGADVINLSFTTNTLDWDESWDDAFLYAFEHEVVVVVAAGNRASGTTVVGAPATIPGVLAVAGVDTNGVASVGASTQGITIGVSAPSEQLLGISASGDVVEWNGTSGAAPIVAGIAALVRSAHPELDAANVINRIIRSAHRPAGVDDVPDALYGYGLVDAAGAVEDDAPSVTSNPLGSLEDWIALHRRAAAGPEPTPTAGAVEIPAIPPADAPGEASSPYLPSADSMREVTLPLFALSAAGILVVLGVVSAVRRVRSTRAQR
ncbi:S8 family serine peptidase [Microbacterium betulae]|uniref:S8 family serine peptidase n=1 Tax=Microbacterium betulae TaxID=2981139 RepID=A0AA97I619_9MICO|nr:S8 family serine peptidase [Microbacterium sp. AB]WOF24361.1 S8 family serine peptidase [Microbacterium sp. AB]